MFYDSFLLQRICINYVFPLMENVVWHVKKKKPGHLVNLGELVGPETYNLLCVALVPGHGSAREVL